MTEAKKNRLLKKIEKLKGYLRKEKSMFGAYHDGSGLRYSIAELYFELGDYRKTNRYLNWFDKNFPDDGKYLYFDLGAAVTKFELGKLDESRKLTINLNRYNTYLIDLLIGEDIKDQDKYEWNPSESLKWAKENLTDHKNLLTENYLNWLTQFRKEDLYKKWYSKLIAIKKLLKGLEVSDERSQLLDAERKCIKDWKDVVG